MLEIPLHCHRVSVPFGFKYLALSASSDEATHGIQSLRALTDNHITRLEQLIHRWTHTKNNLEDVSATNELATGGVRYSQQKFSEHFVEIVLSDAYHIYRNIPVVLYEAIDFTNE
jgi:hypothetical protein